MDASTLTTTTAAAAALDPGAVVAFAVALLAVLGAPWWVSPLVRVAAAAVLGARAAGVKVEPAPPTISDGGTKEDRDLPPAREGGGPAGGGNEDNG